MTFTLRTKIIKLEETFFFLLRICCQCKYGVKIIFDVFAQLVIVLQTQSLTYGQIRSTQFKGSICYTCKAIFSPSKFNNLTHLYCNRKVVSNMQLFCTFAMVLDFLKSPSSLLCYHFATVLLRSLFRFFVQCQGLSSSRAHFLFVVFFVVVF